MFRKSGFTLAEDATHVDICNNTRRTAFTLAEVLITLAIIGVVAAMTIPTLISDYQEKVTVTKVKKMYSTLSNAYQLYVANDGTPQYMDWTEEGASKVYNVFAPYLKIAKDCGTNDQNCISYSVRRLKDGTDDPAIRKNEYDVVLNDGSSISFRGHSDSRYLGVIYYDINT
ncbi:type II secretion system protein, partial [bacterium]|nr:type II secretion system protein [bacterium]